MTRSKEAARSIDQDGVVGIVPSAVQSKTREGKRTAGWETGIDEDDLRYRLAFFFENRRFRLVVDEKGNSIERSTVCLGIREMT